MTKHYAAMLPHIISSKDKHKEMMLALKLAYFKCIEKGEHFLKWRN